MAVWGINWGVFWIFILLGVAMITAGFLVSPEARTDDGHPLKTFLWTLGGLWLAIDLGILLFIRGMAAGRAKALETWERGTATVLSASETGTYVNNMPKVKFTLEVSTGNHGVYRVKHREVVSLMNAAAYAPGSVHEVRVKPGNPRKIMFV